MYTDFKAKIAFVIRCDVFVQKRKLEPMYSPRFLTHSDGLIKASLTITFKRESTTMHPRFGQSLPSSLD